MTENPGREPLKLGVSSCLLGERVRYDGGHKLDTYVVGVLARFFELVSICPEMAIGLGTPRPPIHLRGDPARPRVVGVHDEDLDVTEAMEAFSSDRVESLSDIAGYVLKSKSPSCGIEGVPVRGDDGRAREGTGTFARILMARYPLLPVEEEGRLCDPMRRDSFLERVFAYARWQELETAGLTEGRLIHFHTIHKLSLMAHGSEACRELGRLTAQAGKLPLRRLADDYIRRFMELLEEPATIGRHSDVLFHLMGYLKHSLGSEDKAELVETIEAYRTQRVPLIVPITLLKHHFRHHPHPWVAEQVYLNPPREELLLRYGGV